MAKNKHISFRDAGSVCCVFIAALAAVFSLAACSDDFLDKEPDERITPNQEDQIIQLLSTAYLDANYGWLCEISSDNIIDLNAPFSATQSNGTEVTVHYNLNSWGREDDEAYRFEPVKSSTDSDSPSSIWESCYRAIAAANHALQMMEQLKQQNGGMVSAKLKAAYGEALLSRAYHHFILVNIFSQAYKNDELSKADIGIAYATEPEDKVLVHYERSNVADTYMKIEKDLLAGLDSISDINYSKPKWHFNTNAAHAFAARFYLYKRDYDKVIEHANAVLGTDPASLPEKLMDYSRFDDCTSSTDYAEIWQGPNENNNLMLLTTNSIQWRRHIGYRYATAGKALRDIEFHLGPNWRWYLMPAAGVGGGTFWDGTQDHGFTSARIAERFEYSDKVAGIGWAHVIRREFTATVLLLERAEARLLKQTPDIDGCVADLIAYEESRQSFSESNKAFYTSNNALTPLTRSMIESYYVKTSNSNVFADWNFTQNMSPDFIIPQDRVVYMNCINDMRRYETAYSGLRFFDLKRFGIEYNHVYGIEGKGNDNILTWNDKRRAIEVPQDVLKAGHQSSQEPLVNAAQGAVYAPNLEVTKWKKD